ncbi:MAG TPA: hydrogenase assembly protein HupF [Halieaceae bacterium]|nr:hydrogenase assembly protein HupF [Halieaceae bacterium]
MCLGIPGQIVEIVDAGRKLARVDVAGVRRPINIACVVDETHPPESCVGDWVLVHVGFAMSRIDAVEAEQTLELLRELGEVQDELRAMRESQAEPNR